MNLIKRLIREEQGQDIIEYVLLAAGISIVAIPIIPGIGTAVNGLYGQVNTAVGTVGS